MKTLTELFEELRENVKYDATYAIDHFEAELTKWLLSVEEELDKRRGNEPTESMD